MNQKPKRKRHLPTELEAILVTPPDDISYYMKKDDGQFEFTLTLLEDEAKTFLKRAGHSIAIGDITRSLNQTDLPYNQSEEYAAYLLLAGSKLRKALIVNDAKEAAIQTLILVSAATYAGIEQVITRGISTIDGWSKGGPRKEPAFERLVWYAWQKSKRKTCLSMWKFLRNNLQQGEFKGQKIIDGYDFVYEKKTNKITLYFEEERRRPREMGFRSFQRYISDLKKDLKNIATK